MFRLGPVLLLLIFTYQFVGKAADASSITLREESSAEGSKRTLVDIIWGCISTTIICAWSAIHPNIQPRERPFRTVLRQLELVMWAIVVPECLPAFALNQLLAAMTIRDRYNKWPEEPERASFSWEVIWSTIKEWFSWKYIWQTVKEWFSWNEIPENESREWTVAHGFFVVMGGIRLVEPVVEAKTEGLGCGTTVKPKARTTILTMEMLDSVLQKGIEIKVTEDEIADTAKGDALSKTIFVLQSSWFIVQCIARAVQGLALTQLELTTLALASLNGITLILWWKKPLGAKTVVRVHLNYELTPEDRKIAERSQDVRKALYGKPGSNRSFIFIFLQNAFGSAVSTILRRSDRDENWFLGLPSAIGLPLAIATLLLFPIVTLVVIFVYCLGDVVLDGSIFFDADASHVPTVYAPKHAFPKYWHTFLMMILAAAFGGIHCAGWNFIFPTYPEQKLWRLASLTVTVIPPLLIIILFVVDVLIKHFEVKGTHAVEYFAGIASLPFTLVYVAGRLVIIGQAIALLGHQPPSAFTAVDWSKLYPHIF